jgi:malic enzyme
MLTMIADGHSREALQKFLNTVYTPIVALITSLGRISLKVESPVRARVHDEESGEEIEVDVETGMRAFRRQGPPGNQIAICSAHSRPLGDGEGLILANEELANVRDQVIKEHGPFTSWKEMRRAILDEMEERGIAMPDEPDILQGAEGIMFGKAFLYAVFGGVRAIYYDMSLYSHDKPHNPKTWVTFLKNIFGKIVFFLNIEDTRFPYVLQIYRAVKKHFPELPTLLDDMGGTVDITLAGLEAAAVKSGRRSRKDIEEGGETFQGMTFVVAGSGTAGGETIEKLAKRGASVICTDSKGGLNKARLEQEAESGDELRAAKAREKLKLLDIEGVEEARENESFRDIILRLEAEGRAVDGVIDLSGDSKLGQIDPRTMQSYDTSTGQFLAEHMARNPIVFALTNPTPGIDVEEFLRHVRELDKADSIDPTDPLKGVKVVVATGRGGKIDDSQLAEWYGQVLLDMVNNNFIFPIEARICLDACCQLTDVIRAAVVRSYALSAIDIGRVTPDMWNPEHFAQATRAGIIAARESGVAKMILKYTNKVEWLRTIEESMKIVRDSMNYFIKMAENPQIRKQIEELVGCDLFVK